MNFTNEELTLIVDALAFTSIGDACYDGGNSESQENLSQQMITLIEKIMTENPVDFKEVYLYDSQYLEDEDAFERLKNLGIKIK